MEKSNEKDGQVKKIIINRARILKNPKTKVPFFVKDCGMDKKNDPGKKPSRK